MHDRDTAGKNLLHYLFMSRQESDDIKAMFDVIFKGESPLIGSKTATTLLQETGTILDSPYTPLNILRYRADFHALAAPLSDIFGVGAGIPRSPQRRSEQGEKIFTQPVLKLFTFQLPEVEPEITPLEDICQELYSGLPVESSSAGPAEL